MRKVARPGKWPESGQESKPKSEPESKLKSGQARKEDAAGVYR
jgi:hypothetical protein